MDRWELVEGELVERMGKNRPHTYAAARLVALLIHIFGDFFVEFETPIRVHPEDTPTSQPHPDVMVLRTPNSKLREQARPEDLELVIEVSDSTLVFDLTVKSGLYARAGIPEYWVLDLKSRRMVVHRSPQAGHYQSIMVYSESESVSPLAAPQATLRVTDVLYSPVT